MASATDFNLQQAAPADHLSDRSTWLAPCAVGIDGHPRSCHLLECGHVVAVDDPITKCALNCLHTAQSIKDESSQLVEGGRDLAIIRRNGLALPKHGDTQALDRIYCEMCRGLPISYFETAKPDHGFRRAVALTRPVLEYFVGYSEDYMNTNVVFGMLLHAGVCPEHTHRLCCSHVVVCATPRPCASNCSKTLPCAGRLDLTKVRHGDAIICYECTYRAELVYARYRAVRKRLEPDWVEQYQILYSKQH